ncbi:MAG: response regulator transcription factor [Acidobacteria bacterium]|nr:response regulator transcription factor [Acidobacteriota bacterium]
MPEDKSKNASSKNPIRVILADSQAIFRVGLRKIFALESDLRVVAEAETLGQTLAALAKTPADVVLFEAAMTGNSAEAGAEILKRVPAVRLIVLIEEAGDSEVVEFLRRGACGIVQRAVPPELLIKCVRKCHEGETWLDNRGVNSLIDAYRSHAIAGGAGARPRSQLTDKELLIVSYVTQGMKNKDIAQEIGTTEQVVKNYLRKVYDKLGVSDRLELALYCIHHRLLHGARAGAAGAAEAPPAEAVPSAPDSTTKQ